MLVRNSRRLLAGISNHFKTPPIRLLKTTKPQPLNSSLKKVRKKPISTGDVLPAQLDTLQHRKTIFDNVWGSPAFNNKTFQKKLLQCSREEVSATTLILNRIEFLFSYPNPIAITVMEAFTKRFIQTNDLKTLLDGMNTFNNLFFDLPELSKPTCIQGFADAGVLPLLFESKHLSSVIELAVKVNSHYGEIFKHQAQAADVLERLIIKEHKAEIKFKEKLHSLRIFKNETSSKTEPTQIPWFALKK